MKKSSKKRVVLIRITQKNDEGYEKKNHFEFLKNLFSKKIIKIRKNRS